MRHYLMGAMVAIAMLAVPAMAQEFPLTIEHKFGTTVIEEKPERVATVDYGGADNILALGLQPLTTRYWFGPYEDGLWPWAKALATGAHEVLTGELNFEQIAASEPDLIMAIYSGITDQEYEKLSLIAPVVAVPAGRGDYDLTWQERAELMGVALGREGVAEEKIANVAAVIAAAAETHPDWNGKTFAMLTFWNGSLGLYSASDSSVRTIASMGLSVAPKVKELSSKGEFYIQISQEILPEIDADVLFWYTSPDNLAEIQKLPARASLPLVAEGREVWLSTESMSNGALSHGSLLSLPVAVETLIPMIERALDGDPNTQAEPQPAERSCRVKSLFRAMFCSGVVPIQNLINHAARQVVTRGRLVQPRGSLPSG